MSARRNHSDDLLRNELDIRAKLGDRPADLVANDAVSNIYRAAAAVRRRAEREILTEAGLSWGGFTILWVLWIWGELETSVLAAECDLAKGTLTGMLGTLERQDLVSRDRLTTDRRRVRVSLTAKGNETISSLQPRFNRFETATMGDLSEEERLALSRLLRRVIRNAESDLED